MRNFLILCLTGLSLLLLSCGGGKERVHSFVISSESDIGWDEWTSVTLSVDGSMTDAYVHYRGGGSSRHPKWSLSLKFDHPVELCGLPADKKWVLNASYIDKTFLRHKLSFDLFRMMNPGVNISPQCKFALLQINDDPRGLYVLMQKMDPVTLGISRKDTSSVLFKEPRIFQTGYIPPQDTNNIYQQKFPKKKKDDRTCQIESLRDFLFNSSDSLFRDSIASVFDINNVADWHLLLLFSNNADGIIKNYYLYKVDDATPFRIAPWDYDHSYGRDSDYEYNMLDEILDCDRAVILRRLWEWDSYRTLISNRWCELRSQNIISVQRLEAMVDADAKTIRKAVEANVRIWPVDDPVFSDSNDFDSEINIMKQFFKLNIPRLDSLFNYQSK